MRSVLNVILFCSCLFLMGCPLQTESPIKSEDAVSIPSWLPGRWTVLKDGALSTSSYQIKPDPSGGAKLQVIDIDDAGQPDQAKVRAAILAMIKGQLYMSIYDKGDEATDAGYYHYAVGRSSSGDLQIVPLREDVISFTATGEELAAFIAGHTDSDEYLEKSAIESYRKQK